MGLFLNVLIGITAIPLPITLDYILKYYINRVKKKNKQILHTSTSKRYYYHCLFSTMENFNCRPHIINKEECGDGCSYVHLQTILKFFSSARKSISICMYTLTLNQVLKELIDARDRGVQIRIIADYAMFQLAASKLKLLKYKYGLQVKIPLSEAKDTLMHHKFCLIDENDQELAKLFFGSTNLTLQALTTNFEHLIFTNDPNIIRRYSEEFEYLWNIFISNPLPTVIKKAQH